VWSRSKPPSAHAPWYRALDEARHHPNDLDDELELGVVGGRRNAGFVGLRDERGDDDGDRGDVLRVTFKMDVPMTLAELDRTPQNPLQRGLLGKGATSARSSAIAFANRMRG